jgi:hypothetical protein
MDDKMKLMLESQLKEMIRNSEVQDRQENRKSSTYGKGNIIRRRKGSEDKRINLSESI